jgi:hypothetical protein
LRRLGRAAAAIRILCLHFNYGDCPNLPATCALPSGTRLYYRCDALMANGTLCNYVGHPRIHHLLKRKLFLERFPYALSLPENE